MSNGIFNNYAQKFLNALKPHEVTGFKTALLPPDSHHDSVNRRHVSSSLDLDQLATMKSARPQDGAFFTQWMQCKIKEHHLNQPPANHPAINLRLNGTAWPKSVQKRFFNFCVSKNIDELKIQSHHIILRSLLGRRLLPLLASKKKHKLASHLCDTIGCLSEEHLCIETREVNTSRSRCLGITLHIYGNTAAEFFILQADACQHGEQHKKANGDFFKYSCRKIQVVFLNKNILP